MSGDHNMNQKPCAGRNCGSTTPQPQQAEKQEPVAYTTGHCKEKAQPGGCQLHNLHCGYPDCDRKAVATPPAAQQEPRCAVIVEVFGKDWRLDYMSLPVGKHKLYTQQYVYTTPPAAQRKPLPKGEWPKHPSVDDPYIGYDKSDLDDYAMQVLAAHGIGENK
jgi:hypothetical protein